MTDNLPQTNPALAEDDGRQMFRLVDARVASAPSGGGCGCGGKGHGHGAVRAAGDGQPELARHRGGAHAGGGCGCGGKGHGHGHAVAQQASAGGGCGCGGHGRAQQASAGGGCGCGGHGGRAQQAPASTGVEELVVHSLPKVIRKIALFAALDGLPVGENLILVTPHEPAPVFQHLQDSDAHYRVESLETGPETWRYRVTRVS